VINECINYEQLNREQWGRGGGEKDENGQLSQDYEPMSLNRLTGSSTEIMTHGDDLLACKFKVW
jgi:hypothetical protein